MQRSAFCRYRRELSNAYLLAKFGFDTAELPVAILTRQQFRIKYYYSQSSFRTPPVPSVFEDNPVYRRRRRQERVSQSLPKIKISQS